MAGATLPQKKGGGNLKHNELFGSEMVCDGREGTAWGAPILLPWARQRHTGCRRWDSACARSCLEKDATLSLILFTPVIVD